MIFRKIYFNAFTGLHENSRHERSCLIRASRVRCKSRLDVVRLGELMIRKKHRKSIAMYLFYIFFKISKWKLIFTQSNILFCQDNITYRIMEEKNYIISTRKIFFLLNRKGVNVTFGLRFESPFLSKKVCLIVEKNQS